MQQKSALITLKCFIVSFTFTMSEKKTLTSVSHRMWPQELRLGSVEGLDWGLLQDAVGWRGIAPASQLGTGSRDPSGGQATSGGHSWGPDVGVPNPSSIMQRPKRRVCYTSRVFTVVVLLRAAGMRVSNCRMLPRDA